MLLAPETTARARTIHNRSSASAGRESGSSAGGGPSRRITWHTVEEEIPNSGPSCRTVRFVR